MTYRITLKMLESRIAHLNTITDSPPAPYTRTDDKFTANIGNYYLSEAYGGVCVHRMSNEGGGVSTPIWHGYIPKREALGLLSSFISGIETGKAA